MGYDMYREGDSDVAGHEDYFRLNVWGMSEAVPQLAAFDIVRHAPMPPVPHARDFGVSDDGDDTDLPDDHPYRVAMRVWRDGPAGEGPGIPDYKLDTNDGWLVTPIEIQSGIGVADRDYPEWRTKVFDWVLEFAVWMEGCKGGFRVY